MKEFTNIFSLNEMRVIIILFGLLFIWSQPSSAQECVPWKRFQKVKSFGRDIIYVDTLTKDTMFYLSSSDMQILKSIDGVEIFRGSVFGGMGTICGCTPKPHGYWIKRYRSGHYMETGEYYCNEKIGTWIYYYEDGTISKVESYQFPYRKFYTDFNGPLDTFKTYSPMIAGPYVSYFPNGKTNIEGYYEIVEALNHMDTLIYFDPEQMKDTFTIKFGEFWRPKSIKVGVWKEYDALGNVIKHEEMPLYYSEDGYRELEIRYLEVMRKE